ncbi:hypothetical protein GQ54DRAFT_95359 [Martensiomyces pterosporus]|nr:hypothetical protein GQ54DRAFT_95359 [Martensiomyces pterosporus]
MLRSNGSAFPFHFNTDCALLSGLRRTKERKECVCKREQARFALHAARSAARVCVCSAIGVGFMGGCCAMHALSAYVSSLWLPRDLCWHTQRTAGVCNACGVPLLRCPSSVFKARESWRSLGLRHASSPMCTWRPAQREAQRGAATERRSPLPLPSPQSFPCWLRRKRYADTAPSLLNAEPALLGVPRAGQQAVLRLMPMCWRSIQLCCCLVPPGCFALALLQRNVGHLLGPMHAPNVCHGEYCMQHWCCDRHALKQGGVRKAAQS